VSTDAGAGGQPELYALRDDLMENGISLVDLRRSQGRPPPRVRTVARRRSGVG